MGRWRAPGRAPFLSRGFASAIVGIAMTLLAWYGPWVFPAWPAFTVIDAVFGHGGFAELPYAQRSAVLIGLIVLNVASWGAVARALIWIVERFTRGKDQPIERR
jgi:hypothetical protein